MPPVGTNAAVDCTARESLGTNSLVAGAPSKQTPPFLTVYAENGFFKFDNKNIKTSAIVCEVETVRFTPMQTNVVFSVLTIPLNNLEDLCLLKVSGGGGG
jgi:hypothetical protein